MKTFQTNINKLKLFLIIALTTTAGCSLTTSNKQIILNYLQENTDGMEYTIIEVDKPDSLYSPTAVLGAIRIKKAESLADLSHRLTEAFDKPTRGERRAACMEVAKMAEEEYNHREEFDDILNVIMNPNATPRPANCIGLRAKYKVDGRLKEDVFYLEKNGKAIGHTLSEIRESYLSLCDLNGELFKLSSDAKDLSKTIR